MAVCRWFNGIWCVHELPKQFSILYRSKMEIFAKHFFDIVTNYNDQISYVKHVLDPLCVFFKPFACGGGGSQGVSGITCLCSFSALATQKCKSPQLIFLIL